MHDGQRAKGREASASRPIFIRLSRHDCIGGCDHQPGEAQKSLGKALDKIDISSWNLCVAAAFSNSGHDVVSTRFDV